MGGYFCTLLIRIHGTGSSLNYKIIDSILDVRTFILLSREEAFVVGFIFAEQEGNVSFGE
jgi:hypothetical protein